MRTRTRVAVLLGFLLSMAVTGFARNLPNIDVFGERQPVTSNASATRLKVGTLGVSNPRLQTESRLGVPTFMWIGPIGGSSFAPKRPEIGTVDAPAVSVARSILGEYGPAYGLSSSDVANASVAMVHNTGKGPIIVKFRNQVGGIQIFREEINVMLKQSLEPVAVSGYITSAATPPAQGSSLSYSLGASTVAALAVKNLTEIGINGAQLVPAGSRDGYQYFTLPASSGVSLSDPVRMKQVYFHLPEGLVAAYYVEVVADIATPDPLSVTGFSTSTDSYSYVISAVDGSLLFRKNLTADAQGSQPQANTSVNGSGFTYRVWADPSTGIPYDTPAGNAVHPKVNATPDGFQASFLSPQDVALSNITFSMNDPWLAPGATETVGNNVDAYLNLFLPDGYSSPAPPPADPPTGDFRAQVTAPSQFLHTHVPDTNSGLAEARQGSIQQLFYNNNFLHDWYYDSGFNEASGNAQTANFGRGGLGNDSIKAQAQDTGDAQSGGFSNANMSTPSDGGRPRMRMYVFPNLANMLDIQSPAGIAGKKQVGIWQSGAQAFDITTDIVVATFSNSPSACTVTNAAALNGKIAMFDFDINDGTGCSFSTRSTRLNTTTNAAAILMVYQLTTPTSVAVVRGFVVGNNKPILTTSWNTGQLIKGQLAMAQPVTARVLKVGDRDGDLDQQIVFHEWAHYLSNRLIGDANGIVNQEGRGMGEGWSDFSAMMMTVRENDTATASDSNWNGAYALATYATSGVPFNGTQNQGYYFGIRRYPYSTDMNINPLTFKHIVNGQALPVGPPLAFGASGATNSEVHNTGEVWTTMMWECYASLLRDTLGPNPRMDFATAQDRMKLYLVASLKMTPFAPSFTEARDALLAAAYATDSTDYVEFWAAFAKRGAGLHAQPPTDRFGSTNAGVVEDFTVGPELILNSAALDDGSASCDHDGILDSGDYGNLTITLTNVGGTTLSATTATVSSATPGVSFPNGTALSFPASSPLGGTTSSVKVAYAPGISGVQQLDFHIDFTDAQLMAPRTADVSFRGNTNVIPASSATDTVEPVGTVWTIGSNPSLGVKAPWRRVEVNALSHLYHVDDFNYASDEYLTSPVFTVDGSGSVNVQFDHAYDFEFDAFGNYDGGVIEKSVNGGAWADFGGVPYNGTILAGGANPIAGRSGFIKDSGGTLHGSITSAIAPGSTVQVRFRAGSDASFGTAGGFAGWDVDNIAFTGVVETPFGTLVADPGCNLPTSTVLGTSANPSPKGNSLTLTATVSSSGATPPNGGTVTFLDNGVAFTMGGVVNGVATANTSSLTVGNHTLTAQFGGVAGYAASTSNPAIQTISKAASSTAVSSSLNPSNYGQPVTFFATVTATTGGTPTGSVTFSEGMTTYSTATLNAMGVATWSTVSLAGGSHTMTATYLGSGNHAVSSGNMVQVVNTGSTIAFSAPVYWTYEPNGTVNVTVTRTGGNITGPASVQYATSNGTAAAGVRYTSASGTLNFAPNVTSMPIPVTLLNNSAIEGKQDFSVALSSPTGGSLAMATTAVVNILDDDTGKTDFNTVLDAKNDIVLRNSVTGDLKLWYMNGTAFVSSIDLPRLGSDWRPAAIADFDNDGHADILWRNTVDFSAVLWHMNGTTILSTAVVMAVPDANWVITGVGDFNADGYPDLLWRNNSTFALVAWLMRDNVVQTGANLFTLNDANWQVAGAGDFNRDGKTDIVWRNAATNVTAVWLMNGTTVTTGVTLPSAVAPWTLVGVGDMNGDRDTDLIWRNGAAPYNNGIWLMNQTSLGSGVALQGINDPNWGIIAPR
jgi:large repetitive protein